MSNESNIRKFDVSAFLTRVYAQAQTQMNEALASGLFDDESTEESHDRRIAKKAHYAEYGLSETKNRVTVGFHTDKGLVTAALNTDETGNVILSSVKLLSDRKSLVSKARKAKANTYDIDGKTWAVTYTIKGHFILTDKIALRYDAKMGFTPHTNAAESFWLIATLDRADKHFHIS